MRHSVSIIGAGRLGRALGRRLRERGWRIASVVTTNRSSSRRAVRFIGGGSAATELTGGVFEAAVVLIAVPDSAIRGVSDKLMGLQAEEHRKRVVLHTSGAISSDILAPLRSRGASVGSLHPLQSFSGVAVPVLEGRFFAVEGDAGAVRAARAIVRSLGGQAALLSPSAKPAYHAAAAIASGLVLALTESAVQIFASLGLKRKEALRALLPLTRQVLENQERLGPRAAWTGPLARGDYSVIRAHEDSLRSFPGEYLSAYRALTRLAACTLARDPQSVVAELEKISHHGVDPLAVKVPITKGASA